MNNDLYNDTIRKVSAGICALMADHKEGIMSAIACKIGSTENGKIKVPITFPVTLAPMGDTCGVKVRISYGEKVKDECEAVADSTPELGI